LILLDIPKYVICILLGGIIRTNTRPNFTVMIVIAMAKCN